MTYYNIRLSLNMCVWHMLVQQMLEHLVDKLEIWFISYCLLGMKQLVEGLLRHNTQIQSTERFNQLKVYIFKDSRGKHFSKFFIYIFKTFTKLYGEEKKHNYILISLPYLVFIILL